MPHTRSFSYRTLTGVIGTLAIVVAMAASGCTTGGEPGTAAPTGAATTSPSPSAAALPYLVKDFNICEATDVDLLGKQLAERIEKTEPDLDDADGDVDGDGEPEVAGSVSCVFRMRPYEGDLGSLLVVSATAHESVSAATKRFAADRAGREERMHDDGDVSGVGDQAYVKSLDRYHGFSQNLIAVRTENLVVTVFLSVESPSTVPRTELAAKVRSIAEKLLAAAPAG
ncbi:MAG: hypothetical protein ACRDT4_09305 [Micromonosporaceae bacterium]